MIAGRVRAREARVRLSLVGPHKQERQVEAIVDTGFNASLTMPTNVISELALRWHSVGRGILADGSKCLFDVYEATVIWDGESRRVFVNEANGDPLIGMELLSGYELNLQVRDGGAVTIERLDQ